MRHRSRSSINGKDESEAPLASVNDRLEGAAGGRLWWAASPRS
jgi:hypothetical protein